MNTEILKFVLGPLQNNTYLITAPDNQEAVIVDPASGISTVLNIIEKKALNLSQIWITHAHFDHIAGLREIIPLIKEFPISIGLHPNDLPLWRSGAGARQFGMSFHVDIDPNLYFQDQQILTVGKSNWTVLHTPGHTPGHVSFHNADTDTILCGDVIFREGVGRTDLPGGDHGVLIQSILHRLLRYPPHTRLYCGHGEDTTVQHELKFNPFLK